MATLHHPAIAQHPSYCVMTKTLTSTSACSPAVTGYADVTSTNAGLKSPTQLRTLPNTLLIILILQLNCPSVSECMSV